MLHVKFNPSSPHLEESLASVSVQLCGPSAELFNTRLSFLGYKMLGQGEAGVHY